MVIVDIPVVALATEVFFEDAALLGVEMLTAASF